MASTNLDDNQRDKENPAMLSASQALISVLGRFAIVALASIALIPMGVISLLGGGSQGQLISENTALGLLCVYVLLVFIWIFMPIANRRFTISNKKND